MNRAAHTAVVQVAGATVLVVDDQPGNIQMVGSQLAAAGYDVMPPWPGYPTWSCLIC